MVRLAIKLSESYRKVSDFTSYVESAMVIPRALNSRLSLTVLSST